MKHLTSTHLSIRTICFKVSEHGRLIHKAPFKAQDIGYKRAFKYIICELMKLPKLSHVGGSIRVVGGYNTCI